MSFPTIPLARLFLKRKVFHAVFQVPKNKKIQWDSLSLNVNYGEKTMESIAKIFL